MLVQIGLVILVAFVAGSLFYVYKYRGQARWESLSEYLRKGWPLFTPLNCLLYIFTQKRAKKPFVDLNDFPELKEIHENWETIKSEAVQLYEKRQFDQTTKPGSQASYDIGFRTFFKYGWSKFYLKWYGYTHASAQRLCPKTVEILSRVPTVNGAMFSLLPKGSQLTRHLDPVACSLRYHLGLVTPNDDRCFINVDGIKYSWRDGHAMMFDETYLHFVRNDSDNYRLILMCDVERPLNFIGKIVNFIYKGIARLTVVPNMEGDKCGLVNTVFSSLAPLLAKSKALKQTNRKAYLALKYTVNGTLILLVFLLFAGLLDLIQTVVTKI